MNRIRLLFFLLFLLLCTTASSATREVSGHNGVRSCEVCHIDDAIFYNPDDPNTIVDNNISGVPIRSVIFTPNSGYKEVKLYSRTGANSFADGDATHNGVCEVCHTKNNHHNNNGSDTLVHFDGEDCTRCHLHNNPDGDFTPPVNQSHRTHLDQGLARGPHITECIVCHYSPLDTIADYQYDPGNPQSLTFRDGLPLATTTACDNCHSPWGAYPGGDESTALMNPVVGAKANFRTGIYTSDGTALKDGKEKWCITCHDDRPSTTHYDADPNNLGTPFTMDYLDGNVTYSAGEWGNRSWPGMVAHMRSVATTSYQNAWVTYDFDISVDGTYAIYMKWNVDSGNCDSTTKPTVVSIIDSNGTESKSYSQTGLSSDYSLVQTFDIAAGPATFKMQKDGAVCTLLAGPIEVRPSAGSGGNVVIAPMIAGDDTTWGYYATGHGVSGVECTECHDVTKMHIDYNARTHKMNGVYNPKNPWGDSYRLRTKDPISGESLCARCHDMELIWERADKVKQTNYKNGTNGNQNYHAFHMGLVNMTRADSDWDGIPDSDPRCANCHNVHGSTKPHMFRDGNLVSYPYTSNKKPMYPHAYEVHVKATWKPVLQGGNYEVFARWPDVNGSATNAPYTIKSTEIFSTTIRVDQTANADTWVSLGTYNFDDKNQSYVILNDKDSDGTVIADAVKFVSGAETVIVDNGDNSENGDHNYSTLDVNLSLSGLTGYNGDYDAIAAGTTLSIDTANDNNGHATVDFNKPLLMEQRNFFAGAPGVNIGSAIEANGVCRSCHITDDENIAGGNKPIVHFTGPKILNRYEEKRWVLNDGSEDAEVYITARDYDSNISSVTLDLTSIGGGVEAMTWVEGQTYKYTIPGSMINGLSDVSYKLPVTAVDTDAQSVTDETYLFPKEGNDTIYMDSNDVELSNVDFFRFAVNTAGADWGRLPGIDVTYFGPGYRYTVADINASYGIWTPKIPTTGTYEVYGFWNEVGGSVNYEVHAADGIETVTINQAANPGVWNLIGTYTFLDDDSGYIKQMTNDGTAMVADAMKFVRLANSFQPVVRLGASQRYAIKRADGNYTSVFKPTRIIHRSEWVTVRAVVKDNDDGDTFTYDWSGTDAAVLATNYVISENPDAKQEDFKFNPAGLDTGYYTIQVTVTDSGAESTTAKLMLHIPSSYPILSSATDTDGDGINDEADGLYDSDEDGIPNYLDGSLAQNELPDSNSSAVVADTGFSLRIGSTAFKTGSDDVIISDAELAAYGEDGVGSLADGNLTIGGLFDFDIVGLETVGESVKIVLPLQGGVTIPADAVYRKYYTDTGWADFVIDANNKIHSALKSGGVCPEPGSSSYDENLTAGHECVQLTIQDGGPNDADGLLNAEIKDPGGIMLRSTKIAPRTSSKSKSKGGLGAMEIWSLLLLSLFAAGSFFRRKKG